jgi:hypothetical protein
MKYLNFINIQIIILNKEKVLLKKFISLNVSASSEVFVHPAAGGETKIWVEEN